MKKTVLNFFALALLGSAFTACDDAKNDVIDNMVYISEAASETSSEVILSKVAGEQSKVTVNVRMARPVAVDTKVKLTLDQNALDAFNKRNEVTLQMIPAEYISYPAEVVIPSGSAVAEVELTVTSFEGEAGAEYAAPLKISAADGMAVSEGSASFIYTFGKPLEQLTPKLYNDNAMNLNWPETVSLPNLTLEWWVRVVNLSGNGGFSTNNQALFNFEANHELYVRFGDLTYGGSDGRAGKHEFLQIKTCSIDANYDSGDPNEKDKKLPWGEWIHFAHTYNSATGDLVLYKNGVEVNRQNGGAGKVFDITGVSMCSSGTRYFRDYMEFAQVRLWKVTRTAAQIAKYMKKEVKYNDPNLVFYLPMNEGEGSVLHDVTGNGHDATLGTNSNSGGGGNNQAHAWTLYEF